MRDAIPGKRDLAVAEQSAAEQVADGVVLALDCQSCSMLDAGVSGVGDALDPLGDDELFVAVVVCCWERKGGGGRSEGEERQRER